MFHPSIGYVEAHLDRLKQRIEQSKPWDEWSVEGHDPGAESTPFGSPGSVVRIQWRFGQPNREVIVTNLSTAQAMARAVVGFESWVVLRDEQDVGATRGLNWPDEPGWLLATLDEERSVMVPEFILAELATWLDQANVLRGEAMERSVHLECPGRPIVDQVAEHLHEARREWLAELLSDCGKVADGSLVLSAESREQWDMLLLTPFHKLSDRDKAPVLTQAAKVQKIYACMTGK
jgi:hypothetical protein